MIESALPASHSTSNVLVHDSQVMDSALTDQQMVEGGIDRPELTDRPEEGGIILYTNYTIKTMGSEIIIESEKNTLNILKCEDNIDSLFDWSYVIHYE